jgi:hypothetical protein
MKYAYLTKLQGNDNSNCYVTIFFDRILFQGDYYDSCYSSTPNPASNFLKDINTTHGVSGTHAHINGSELTVQICHFNVAATVSNIIKKVQRRFAPFESVQRVGKAELEKTILALNITPELTAADVMIEAAKLLPNQDPIRLASAIKDLNLPPIQAIAVITKLAPYFQGDNGDPIRLISGFKTILTIVKN